MNLKLPPCGAYCEDCGLREKCEGCIETEGKPFYVKEAGMDICPVWKCVAKQEVEHCGLCKEFPCNEFLSWYDPKRGIITALRRAGLLALRKKIGTSAWIKWIKDKKLKFGIL